MFDAIGSSIQKIGWGIAKNSPTIFTWLAVGGVASTVLLAVKATPKALCLIDDELYSYMGDDMYGEYGNTIQDRIKFLPTKTIVKLTWKCYLPSMAMGLVTAGCIVGANSINLRRNAALATIYTITEQALKEYQAKVIETIGEKKEHKIRDDITADRIRKNPLGANEIIFTGNGEVLCYDSLSGRYFKSDVEKIRRTINDLNQNLVTDLFVTVNDLYYGLGLSGTAQGDQMGWSLDHKIIVTFSSHLTEKNEPCLALTYEVFPIFI